MPMYLGRDGQIYNRPVPGATLIQSGTVNPPPRPRNNHEPDPAPPTGEAGFFRKTLFWLTALGSAGGMGYAAGTILSTQVFPGISMDGFLGTVAGLLGNSAPVILCLVTLVACLVCGVAAGEDHNYNLLGLIFTLLSTAGVCLGGALLLALAPYGLALIAYLIVGALIIGVIASLFGG